MGIGKQAKTLNSIQVEVILHHIGNRRNGVRNKVIFLLSIRAGLRAKEIAKLKWSMVVGSDSEIGDSIHLTNEASKGNSGRIIPINKALKATLSELYSRDRIDECFDQTTAYAVTTERSKHASAQAIVNQFQRWYRELGLVGCSSHSGRRTFITNAARKISTVGGSLRDIQSLAGHSSLQTTQRYIEVDNRAKRLVIDLL